MAPAFPARVRIIAQFHADLKLIVEVSWTSVCFHCTTFCCTHTHTRLQEGKVTVNDIGMFDICKVHPDPGAGGDLKGRSPDGFMDAQLQVDADESGQFAG